MKNNWCCACGCGQAVKVINGKPNRFIHGHHTRLQSLSEKHKRKIGLASKGRKHSEETKEKIRQKALGRPSAKKGCTVSDETREKLRQAALGKSTSTQTRQKISESNTGRKHPKEVRENMRKAKLKEKNPNWKGDIVIYDYVYVYSDGRGRIKQERLIMENHLGRPLKKEEIVHHKNGIKTDNRLSNLQIMTDSAHKRLHAKQDRR